MQLRRQLSAVLAAVVTIVGLSVVPSSPAQAATATQLRFVTANVDFHQTQAEVAKGWREVIAPNADIVFLQEVKNVKLTNFVNTDLWRVWQDTSSADRAGSAVLVRRSVITDAADYGLVKGVAASYCPGGGIMTRWITKVNIRLNNGRWIRIASLHMPPGRCQTGPGGPYDTMADNVVGFVQRTDRLTVLGADWNKIVDDDPNNIGARSGLEPNGPDSGNRIDGFMYSRQLTNCCLTKLASIGAGGHLPVQIRLTIPAP